MGRHTRPVPGHRRGEGTPAVGTGDADLAATAHTGRVFAGNDDRAVCGVRSGRRDRARPRRRKPAVQLRRAHTATAPCCPHAAGHRRPRPVTSDATTVSSSPRSLRIVRIRHHHQLIPPRSLARASSRHTCQPLPVLPQRLRSARRRASRDGSNHRPGRSHRRRHHARGTRRTGPVAPATPQPRRSDHLPPPIQALDLPRPTGLSTGCSDLL
ncbi:Uncharacterised protein [Mycobacteroides abscessus subsp. abscessus]|nr:Uncharacterised protein [Mycobacteroides abscessus subsp. abscessus]